MELLKEFSLLIVLLLSFLGHGIFLKKKTNMPDGIIPIFIFSTIIIIEYFAALINLLVLSTYLVLFTGLVFTIYYSVQFFLNLGTLTYSRLIEKIRFEKEQLSGKLKNLRGENLSILLLIPISICLAVSISTRIEYFWIHRLMIKILILSVLFLISLLVMWILNIQFSRKNKNKYKKTLLCIAVAIICTVIFFPSKWPSSSSFPKSTVSIELINAGKRNPKSEDYLIKVLEIKDSVTQEKIGTAQYNGQVIHEGDLTFLLIDQKDERDVFKYTSDHVKNLEFTFIKDPKSGIVKINIDGSENEVDLYSNITELTKVAIPIKYNALTYLVLIADIMSFIVTIVLVSWICINDFYPNLKNESVPCKIKPGLILLLLGSIALFFITRNFVFFLADEFGHWATLVKELSITNELPGKLFCSQVPNYIPGYSLYQYFFVKILGFTEGKVYFSQSIFILAGMYVLISDFEWRRLFKLLISIICMFLVMCLLPLYFFSNYVDVTLGISFGVAIISYLIFVDKKISILFLLIFLSATQLIKDWGLVFAVMVFCIVICHQIFCLKIFTKDSNKKREFLLFIIFFILSTLIIQISWQNHLLSSNVRTVFPTSNSNENEIISDAGVIPNAAINNGINLSLLYTNLINTLKDGRNNNLGLYYPFSIINIAGFIFMFGMFLSTINKSLKRDLFMINAAAAFFFIIDLVLLVSYYIWQGAGSEELRSFERYISEYLVGWFLVLVHILNITSNEVGERKSHFFISLASILLVIILLIGVNQNSHFYAPRENYSGIRSAVHESLIRFPELFYQGQTRQKIYIINQDASPMSQFYIKYELCPNLINSDGFSISTIPNGTETTTTIINPDIFYRDVVSNYNFVLIMNSNTRFWNEYASLFPGHSIENNQLYKVANGILIRSN